MFLQVPTLDTLQKTVSVIFLGHSIDLLLVCKHQTVWHLVCEILLWAPVIKIEEYIMLSEKMLYNKVYICMCVVV